MASDNLDDLLNGIRDCVSKRRSLGFVDQVIVSDFGYPATISCHIVSEQLIRDHQFAEVLRCKRRSMPFKFFSGVLQLQMQ